MTYDLLTYDLLTYDLLTYNQQTRPINGIQFHHLPLSVSAAGTDRVLFGAASGSAEYGVADCQPVVLRLG